MKNVLLLILLVFGLGLPLPLPAAATSSPAGPELSRSAQVFVIPVAGEVEPVMAAYIERAVAVAVASGPEPLIILEMDTFGGRVDAALAIVDTMTNVTRGRTVAFVKTKAISAGALISLACNMLVMKPNTTLGDAAPIAFAGNEPQLLGEKFQSPLRAKFRTLARRNGYPPVLAEAMVSAGLEVYQVRFPEQTVYLDAEALAELPEARTKQILSKTTVVAKGELLTMDDTEALELGFSRLTAVSIVDMLEKLEIRDYQLTRLEQNWAESWARRIALLAPLLMIIGMAALYTELKAPGFGLPGIIGLICLGLVLFNQHLVGLADNLELILFALGLIMLGFEIFVIPGFGVAGIAGFLLIGAGLLLSFQDFVWPDPAMPWQAELFAANLLRVLGALAGSFLLALVFIRYGLPRLGRVVAGPYLEDTLAGSHADSDEARTITVGQTGIAATSLRPAGKMKVGDLKVDVVSEGGFIEKGARLKVIAIKGNRVIVAEE